MKLKETEEFFEKINEIYEKIPKREKTFMDISGYPHYENVCSNILSFYLNPNEEHGLNDMVMKAFLDIIKEKDKEAFIDVNLSNINVIREYTTEKGNRIDIVLQNDEIIIGIENKIMAKVYNDLADYSNTIQKINNNAIKILLSLHYESIIAAENKFINITYNEFFKKLKENLEEYNDKQNKWYIYLIDFIKNIEGFEGEENMEIELNEWIKNNQEEIDKFYKVLNTVENNLNKKANKYGVLLEEKISAHNKVKYWNGDNLSITAYITLEIGCNLDAKITVDGWKIGVFIWKKLNQVKIKQALNVNGYNILEEENGHVWIDKFDYECEIDEVVNKAKKILNLLSSIN